jgi:hypothetical protein
MEKISWTDRVRNEEVLQRVKEERNIVHTIKRWKANWIGHILRRNCLLKHVIEGKLKGRIEMTGRRGRRRKQLLDDLKEKRRYWKLKAEALDRTLWRSRFGRGYGAVVRHYRMNEALFSLIIEATISPKTWHMLTRLHGIIFQKISVFTRCPENCQSHKYKRVQLYGP